MEKRAPGQPLSDAELKQRRDAARSRWEKAAGGAGAVAGAAAGGGAAAAVARTVERWRAARAVKQGQERGAQQDAWGKRLGEKVEERGQRQAARARAGDVVPKYRAFLERRSAEAGRDLATLRAGERPVPGYRNTADRLAPVKSVVQDGRKLTRFEMEFVDNGAPLGPSQLDDALQAARARWRETVDKLKATPKAKRVKVAGFERAAAKPHDRKVRVSDEWAASRSRAARATAEGGSPRVDSAKAILASHREAVAEGLATDDTLSRRQKAELGRARRLLHEAGQLPEGEAPPPARGKKRGVRVEPIHGASVRSHTRKVPRAWPDRKLSASWRAEMSADIREGTEYAVGNLRARVARRAAATRAAGIGQARAILARLPGRTRAAGAAAGAIGAALGGFAAWRKAGAVEKLAKAAPRGSAALVSTLATRLAGLFRAWGQDPASIDAGDAVREAVEPAADAFRLAAESVQPRLDGDSTQAPMTGDDPRRTIAFNFDARNPRVEQYLRGYELDLIRNLTDQSREAVRTALRLGAMTGASIPEQARLIRQSVGLAPGQVAWVQSYRMQLRELNPAALNRNLRDARFDSTLQRAIANGVPLSDEQVERMVDAYSRRTLAYRATSIARTEGLRAATEGSLAQVRAMLESDSTLDVEKTWHSTEDDRVREEHQHLDGESVTGLETAFLVRGQDGQTHQIRYPRDPLAPAHLTIGCRCTMSFRLVPRADLRRTMRAEAV